MAIIESEKREIDPNHSGPQVIVDPTNDLWRQAVEIEAGVFIESDYVQNQEELGVEYAKYLPTTEFIVAAKDGMVGGSVRAIFYDESVGFKTIDDISTGKLEISEEGREILNTLDLTQTFEIGTLAVNKDFRGKPDDEGRLSVQLYGAIYAEAKRHGTQNVIASFDERYFNSFSSIFGPGVKALGPATDYMGSPTVPALLNTEAAADYLSGTLPEVHESLISSANQTIHG